MIFAAAATVATGAALPSPAGAAALDCGTAWSPYEIKIGRVTGIWVNHESRACEDDRNLVKVEEWHRSDCRKAKFMIGITSDSYKTGGFGTPKAFGKFTCKVSNGLASTGGWTTHTYKMQGAHAVVTKTFGKI